jgi:hypothetical protein
MDINREKELYSQIENLRSQLESCYETEQVLRQELQLRDERIEHLKDELRIAEELEEERCYHCLIV